MAMMKFFIMGVGVSSISAGSAFVEVRTENSTTLFLMPTLGAGGAVAHAITTGWFPIPADNEFFSLPGGLFNRRMRIHLYDTVIGLMDSDIEVQVYDHSHRIRDFVPRRSVTCIGLNIGGEKEYDGTLELLTRSQIADVRRQQAAFQSRVRNGRVPV